MSRGRKSAAELAVVATNFDLPRAPEGYSREMSEHWRAIVSGKPEEWWDSGNLPILDDYIRSIMECQRLNNLIDAVHPVEGDDDLNVLVRLEGLREKVVSRKLRCATKLRLTNQARYDAQKANSRVNKGGTSKLWEVDEDK